MKKSFLLILIFTLCTCVELMGRAQEDNTQKSVNKVPQELNYAYIVVKGKFLSKKLNVKVDLGDSESQIREGITLSETLSEKKSYAAVLNFMASIGYELVNTLDLISINSNSSGGTDGIVYVMKIKK